MKILNDYLTTHEVKAGIVTLEKKPDYTKWLKKAPILSSMWQEAAMSRWGGAPTAHLKVEN